MLCNAAGGSRSYYAIQCNKIFPSITFIVYNGKHADHSVVRQLAEFQTASYDRETVAEQLKLPGFFHRAAKIQTLMFFPLYCRRCCLLIISIVLWISASYQGSANIQSSTAPPPRIAVIATQSSESSLTRDIASFLNLDLQWFLSVNELANLNVVRKDQSLTLYAQP